MVTQQKHGFFKTAKFREGTMKPKKDTKFVSHKEHEEHKEHKVWFRYATGGCALKLF
jgi:hypothetical protein